MLNNCNCSTLFRAVVRSLQFNCLFSSLSFFMSRISAVITPIIVTKQQRTRIKYYFLFILTFLFCSLQLCFPILIEQHNKVCKSPNVLDFIIHNFCKNFLLLRYLSFDNVSKYEDAECSSAIAPCNTLTNCEVDVISKASFGTISFYKCHFLPPFSFSTFTLELIHNIRRRPQVCNYFGIIIVHKHTNKGENNRQCYQSHKPTKCNPFT